MSSWELNAWWHTENAVRYERLVEACIATATAEFSWTTAQAFVNVVSHLNQQLLEEIYAK